MEDIDVTALKAAAPLVPYVKRFYPQFKFISENERLAICYCIWHNENNPSLVFYKDTNTYKCNSGECGVHGDVITLVQELENLTFQEACLRIGNNVGYEIHLTPPNPYYQKYYEQMETHMKRYQTNLEQNQQGLQYLHERGLTNEIIERFQLGLTDVSEYKYRMEPGGISNRISFPIFTPSRTHPRCVGFGYRALNDVELPKYINDPNQEGRITKTYRQQPEEAGVFVKGNLLYGYSHAIKSILETKYVILAEGYMDTISLHQAGLTNACSIMGTNLTKEQLHLISSVTNNVFFLLDGDKAGLTAMQTLLPKFFEEGLQVQIGILPYGADPANICQKYAFDKQKVYACLTQNIKQAYLYLIDIITSKYQEAVFLERKRAIQRCEEIESHIKNPTEKELFKQTIFKRLEM